MLSPQHVGFMAADGARIVGSVFLAPPDDSVFDLDGSSAAWALLLHAMPMTKESWEPFAQALNALGVNVLAIDERGHGESVKSETGPLDYRAFSDAEHQAKLLDVDAAVGWLISEKGAVRSRIALCGASIGANLALAYVANDQRFPAVAALSPGLDYRGITTEDKVVAMPAATRVLLAASDDDPESYACVRQLKAMRPGVTLRELHGAGHGTRMFEANPEFFEETAVWLRKALR